MTINYGLVVEMWDGEIEHFVGYEKPPSGEDREAFAEELETDPEFGFVGRTGYTIRDATEAEISSFRRMIPGEI